VERGRTGIDDGQHRIAVAAERGQGIEVAVRTAEEARALQQMASGNPDRAQRLQRQIGRENTMFETRQHALGGSRTAENLADAAALGKAPAIAQQIITGNVGGAIRTSLQAIMRHASGSTPTVRAELGDLLMMRGGTVTAPELQRLLNEATQRVREARTRALLVSMIAARTGTEQLSGQ
jgi:hypothetical protein